MRRARSETVRRLAVLRREVRRLAVLERAALDDAALGDAAKLARADAYRTRRLRLVAVIRDYEARMRVRRAS